MDILSLVVSAISVAVAGWAKIGERRLQKRMVDLEEAREEDRIRQQESANLSAAIEKRMGNSRMRTMIIVRNSGECEARDISIKLDGQSLDQHPVVPRGITSINFIGPGSEGKILIGPSKDNPGPFTIDVSWTDDTGERKHYLHDLVV